MTDAPLPLPDVALTAIQQRLQPLLATATGLEPSLAHVAQAAHELLGPGLLLTLNAQLSYPLQPPVADDAVLLLQRVWSSNPGAYPVTGQKHKSMTAWTRQLLVDGQVFVGEGDAAIAQHFADHATIAALGLHSVVNVPLCDFMGRCYATFNLLGPQRAWTAQDLQRIRTLAALAAPAVELHCQGLRQALATPA